MTQSLAVSSSGLGDGVTGRTLHQMTQTDGASFQISILEHGVGAAPLPGTSLIFLGGTLGF